MRKVSSQSRSQTPSHNSHRKGLRKINMKNSSAERRHDKTQYHKETKGGNQHK